MDYSMGGRFGNTLLTNGRLSKNATAAAEQGMVERWRIVNTSNARTMQIGVEGASFRVIATDGGLLPEPYVTKRITIPVGQRYDLEVTYDQPGTAKLVKAGAKIRFNLHYHASGTETVDRTRVGLKFYPQGYTPKYHQISLQIANSHDTLDIPPNTVSRHDGYYRFSKPARITALQPHMHNRGKRMCVEAILPNGRAEMLNCMGFEFNWHKVYNYADEATPLVPAGTMLHTILWHDNTAANRSNPDPRNWVGYGQRTIDEMAFAWVTWTYLAEDDYKQMTAERNKRRSTERER